MLNHAALCLLPVCKAPVLIRKSIEIRHLDFTQIVLLLVGAYFNDLDLNTLHMCLTSPKTFYKQFIAFQDIIQF